MNKEIETIYLKNINLFSDNITKVVASIDDYNQSKSSESGKKERLSNYLLRKGVLSPKMLEQLQSEFLVPQNTEPKSTSSHNKIQKSKSKTKKSIRPKKQK